MQINLSNKTALITGSSKGIGLSIASKMLAANAGVILNSRNDDELSKTANTLRENFPEGTVNTAPFDLSETKDIPNWFAQVSNNYGPIQILVNNAGITHRETAKDIKEEDFNRVLKTNLNAVLVICQEFFLQLQNRPGKIINISSLISNLARETNIAYAASKGALNQLTRSLAIEWATNGINVNAIAPGFIYTDLTESLVNDEKFNHWVKTRVPMSRWGTPNDISSTAVFLASSEADYITGQIIYVDGGTIATL